MQDLQDLQAGSCAEAEQHHLSQGKAVACLIRIRDAVIVAEVKKVPTDVLRKLRSDFAPFCRKYGVRSLAVFGSLARGSTHPDSDLDLLVDLAPKTTIPEILEMAGEAEEIAGRPVDFVMRGSLLKTSDRKGADHIFSTAVFLYGH